MTDTSYGTMLLIVLISLSLSDQILSHYFPGGEFPPVWGLWSSCRNDDTESSSVVETETIYVSFDSHTTHALQATRGIVGASIS